MPYLLITLSKGVNRIIMSIGFIMLIGTIAKAQSYEMKTELLSDSIVNEIFTDSLRNNLEIRYPIYMACKYLDSSGTHYLLLTEKKYAQERSEILNDSIKAFSIHEKKGRFFLDWELTDFKLKENEVSEEYSIGFWPKYCALNDFDEDGLMDAIIVYGTFGEDGTDNGRIKIIAYSKGRERVIFHQNGKSENDRFTVVDRRFYDLPSLIQKKVVMVMENMELNEHAFFPYCWEDSMGRKEVRFDAHSW